MWVEPVLWVAPCTRNVAVLLNRPTRQVINGLILQMWKLRHGRALSLTQGTMAKKCGSQSLGVGRTLGGEVHAPAVESGMTHCLAFQGEPPYSSHSSSNTLSSNASSSHSDDRWLDPLDPLEPEQDPLSKGGSSDSGIDTTLYTSSPSCMSLAKVPRQAKPHKPPGTMGLCGGGREAAGRSHHADRRREVSPAPVVAGQTKGYRPKLYSSGSSTPTGLAGGSRDPPRQPR